MIEHAFGALKNQWRILKNFNMEVNKVAIVTLAYCILHNFCETYSEQVPLQEDVDQPHDQFVGVLRGAMGLPSDGRAGKVAEEYMRAAIFESLVARNPAL